jgi:hypothetical protein
VERERELTKEWKGGKRERELTKEWKGGKREGERERVIK